MAKKSNNDSLIVELKRQVEEKKAALSAAKAFNPKTNCSLLFQGERVNLKAVVDKDRLMEMLVHLNMLRLSCKDLNLDDFTFSGAKLEDWISDINTRLTILNRKQEEDRLKTLEERLYNLLSADKKVELEIEDLKKLI